MQAIRTRYLRPTNHRCARIVAEAQAGRKVYAWDYALNVPENHRKAAIYFATAFGWHGRLVTGALPDGSYAHVFAGQS